VHPENAFVQVILERNAELGIDAQPLFLHAKFGPKKTLVHK
jgi:hypothetical protein